MLKIEINYESTIKIKNSKAKLFSIFKRIYFFKIIYFLKKNKNLYNYVFNFKNKKLTNKITLIRSPFHYKNSKTILNMPKQNFKILIIFNKKLINPIFFNLKIKLIFLNLNKLNNFQIKTIKITHLC